VVPGCCPRGVSQVKGIQFQNADLSMHRTDWNGQNIRIPKYINLISIKLEFVHIKVCDNLPGTDS
jgi:hypothetical protein